MLASTGISKPVGCAAKQIVGVGIDNAGQGFHRARRDDHAIALVGTAGNHRTDVVVAVKHVGQAFHILRFPVGLDPDVHPGGRGHDQVRFDTVLLAQGFEEANTVDDATCAGYSDDKTHAGRLPFRSYEPEHNISI